MRPLLLTFFSVLALAANAQSWELGSTELSAAPYGRDMLGATASDRTHLVTWVDEGELIYAARYTGTGEVLDPIGLYVGRNDYFIPPRTASDGEDFLVAWYSDRAELRTTRITAGGQLLLSDWFIKHATPHALVSNGRTYLLVYSRHQEPNRAVLLDRNGVPISGTLELPAAFENSLASRAGMWLLACADQDRQGYWRWRSAEIFETDFPRLGETKVVELTPMFEGERPSRVAIAASPRGFVSARIVDDEYRRSEIALRWHTSNDLRPILRPDIRVTVDHDVEDLFLEVDGAAAYVAYRVAPACQTCESENAAVLRIDGTRVDEVVPVSRADAAVSVSALGAAAFWIDEKDQQVYAARVAAGASTGPAQHVSGRLAQQIDSMLVSGAGVHLAVWRDFGRERHLAYAILADDGEPITPHLTVGEFAYYGPWAATDGRSFAIVWMTPGGDWRACIVVPDGTIVRGPFTLPLRESDSVASVLWDGATLVFGLNRGQLARVSLDGAVERVRLNEAHTSAIQLLPDERGFTALAWDIDKIGCQCGFNVMVSALPLDRDLRSDAAREDSWRGKSWDWWTWSVLGDVAAGGGHRLLIRDDGWGNEGLRAIGDDGETRELPYGANVYAPVSVKWDGEEFLVAAGNVLARHAPDGTFRSIVQLPPGTLSADVAVDRNRVPIVLTERYVGRTRRLLVTRLRTASVESAPATR